MGEDFLLGISSDCLRLKTTIHALIQRLDGKHRTPKEEMVFIGLRAVYARLTEVIQDCQPE
jgi:hypothetical protein